MTKLQQETYDELTLDDERPRVCGGAVFLKLIEKSRCRSSKKNESPILTSSSSYTSSQESSENNYDPSKAAFCMPRQVEGVGTATVEAEEQPTDCYKLDFKLQENSDFIYNNDIDGTDLFFLKETEEDGFALEERPGSLSIMELDLQAVNDLKTKHMQSMNGNRTSGDGFLVEETEKVNGNENVLAAWNQLGPMKQQGPHESRANVLRKEMSSFRKELNAVKRSLPNQFDTNHFSDESGERKEIRMSELHAAKNKVQPTHSDESDAWNVDAFPLNSKAEGKQVDVNGDQKYFKNDWNLSFQDQENNNKNTEAVPAPKKLSSSSSFPECGEMPFDQGFNPEEIAINESTSSEKRESNKNLITSDKEQDDRASSTTKSNYEEDMQVVRMLLRKYGENIDDKMGVEKSMTAEKARRILNIVDGPTDTWFHRHATGVSRKYRKSSMSKADGALQQRDGCNDTHEHVPPEKPKQSETTPVQVSSKKTNRVHFKNPAVEEATEKSESKPWESSTGIKTIEERRQPSDRNTVTASPLKRRESSTGIRTIEEHRQPVNRNTVTASPSRRRESASGIVSMAGIVTIEERRRRPIDRNTVSASPSRRRGSSTGIVTIEERRRPIDKDTVAASPAQSPGRLSDKIKFWEEKKI